MVTTLNKALDEAAAGNWDEAWETAKQDCALATNVTQGQWMKWAARVLDNRREHEAAVVPAAYYA